MANMKEVNKAIKVSYPSLDIEAVRGNGYVYFDGNDGYDKIESIMVNAPTTSTATLIRLCLEEINYVQGQSAAVQ